MYLGYALGWPDAETQLWEAAYAFLHRHPFVDRCICLTQQPAHRIDAAGGYIRPNESAEWTGLVLRRYPTERTVTIGSACPSRRSLRRR